MYSKKNLIFIITVSFLWQLVGWVDAAEKPTKPNIIFFLADDQRDDTLGCAGDKIIHSPNLDSLASRGVRFENAFCEVPICAASRATLLSGLTQRTHGYNFLELPVPYEYVATSYPAMLKDAGYRIGFAGKYGTRFERQGVKKKFDFMKHIGRNPYLKKMPDGTLRHETDLCADAAIEFIKSTPEDKPFCMSVSFNATHAEDKDLRPGYHFQWPESADGLYEDVEFPAPELSDEKYFKAMPPFLQKEKGLSRSRYYWRWDTPEKYQTNIRAYYRMITGIDNAIARVLKVLKEKGLDENTIIVYSADNGFMRGDRGTAGKWNHYEQSLRIPLIVFDPRLPEANRGRVVSEMVNNVDLPATFVDFAGLEIPAVYQGHSILPLLQGEEVKWREDIFTEHKFKAYNNWHAVRNERYKYASYYEEEGGPYECLYDLEKDPVEFVNLANNPEYASVLKKMKARMSSYLDAYPKAPQKKSGKSKKANQKNKK
jgi:arylsulfatase A-like enzyme